MSISMSASNIVASKGKTKKNYRVTKTSSITNKSNEETPNIIKITEQKESKAVVKKEKINLGLNFKRNKTTGTYSVLSKNNKRIRSKVKRVFLPFGLEVFGESEILNVYFKILNNFHHNFMVWMKEIDARLKELSNRNTQFDLTDMEYQPIIRENHFEDAEGNKVMQYYFRTHLTPGVKINHKSYFGNYDKRALKGKQCNIEFHIGSLWLDPAGKKYGCTVYVTQIDIL